MAKTNASIGPAAIETALRRASAALAKPPPGYESHVPTAEADVVGWLKRLEQNTTPAQTFWSVDDRELSLLQSYLAREGQGHGGDIQQTRDGYEAKFDNLDPRWIWSLRDWAKGLSKHDFVWAGVEPAAIRNDFRVAVVGDWGTGLYGAPRCAQAIDALASVDLILHLGDVYYAGDRDEVSERFLAHWPTRTDATHRALNGNHEMYTGGKGYFDLILADARFKQPASYFAFANDHWLLVGLDTAYEEHDLYSDQAAWLQGLVDNHPGKRVMLFSHHQPFSAFEKQGLKLQHKLAALLASRRIAAWYWGHEHACVRYDEHPTWKMRGRCIGHGGFPYFRFMDRGGDDTLKWVDGPKKNNVPACQVLDGANPFVTDGPSRYGPNGYVTLDVQGRKVFEQYCDPTGTVVGEYEFTAA